MYRQYNIQQFYVLIIHNDMSFKHKNFIMFVIVVGLHFRFLRNQLQAFLK